MTTIVPERITVTIDAPEVGTPLAADEALRQFLDIFELLTAAGGVDASPVLWKLVDISKRNPVTMVAEAVSRLAGFPIEDVARREKAVLSEAIIDLTTRRRVPRWMDKSARLRAQSLFNRNTLTIGRTNINFAIPDQLDATIVEHSAKAAVSTLQVYEQSLEPIDRSRTEVGSVEAYVISAETHYGHPALRVKERLSGAEIVCVLLDELVESVGIEHNWAEVWKN